MGKCNSKLLGQGRWTLPAFLFSNSSCCQLREMSERKQIQICHYSLPNKWEQVEGTTCCWPGKQKHWFVALGKENIDRLNSEAASSKGLPYFHSQPLHPLDSCSACFVPLCIYHALPSTRFLWVSHRVIVTRVFGDERNILETEKLVTREAK